LAQNLSQTSAQRLPKAPIQSAHTYRLQIFKERRRLPDERGALYRVNEAGQAPKTEIFRDVRTSPESPAKQGLEGHRSGHLDPSELALADLQDNFLPFA